jgi:hypothetical protein
MDALAGDPPRRCLTEVCGPEIFLAHSPLLRALAAANPAEEICTRIDASNALT